MIKTIVASAFVILLAGACSHKSHVAGKSKQKLVWSDEFNYTGLPDPAKWGYDEGDGCPDVCGWGNEELEFYTAKRLENARVENGHLIIEARKEPWKKNAYTSARLVTKGKGDWKYGRIEVKAKLPKGRGTWPAIWMLPTDWAYGGWPASGEIDIMEHVGYEPDSVAASIHTASYNHIQKTQRRGDIFSKTFESAFHEYAIEWRAGRIDFFMDGVQYHSFSNENKTSAEWPFDRTFHLILNIAVGGFWGGHKGVDENIWPQRMEVDYVRVYSLD